MRHWTLVAHHNDGTGVSSQYTGALVAVLARLKGHQLLTPDATFTLRSEPVVA